MRKLRMLWARVQGQAAQGREDEAFDEEIGEHIALLEQRYLAQGMSAREAARAARRQFGNVTGLKERQRAQRGILSPAEWWRDIRYGIRMLRRSGGFTVVAVCALALGIGINTAVFTAYKAFFKRSLDGRDSGRLVNTGLRMQSGQLWSEFSYPDYEAYRDNLHSFDGLIAWKGIEMLSLSGVGDVETNRARASGTLVGRLGLLPATVSDAEFAGTFLVSENYFQVLGVSMLRGRAFAQTDLAPTTLISENYWKKRFDGDPGVLGKSVRLNGIAFAIVGITPHNFVGTNVAVPDFWLPMSALPLIEPGDNWLRQREDLRCRIFGRLAAGVTMAAAQAEMTAFTLDLRKLHDPHSDWKPATAVVWPGSPFPRPLDRYNGLKYAIFLIMAVVAMVLVIACANVASLQLARMVSRQNELSTRMSLGASRGRIVRQLLTESALLGLLAGVFALLFSWAFLQAMVVVAATEFPAQYGTIIFHVTPDLGIFGYVLGVSLFAGVLLGLAPALESSRGAVPSPKESAGTSSKRSRRLRDTLMTVQVAISVALMIAGSMLIRSSIRALTTETGFETRRAFELKLQFPLTSDYSVGRKLALVKELRSRLSALPGAVAITSGRAPDGETMRSAAVSVNGEKPSAENTKAVLYYTYVEPNYFETLSIPLLAGRSSQSRAGEMERGVVLSESAAQQLWPGQNPVGRSVRFGDVGRDRDKFLPDGQAYQVIGVARDTRGVLMDGSDAEEIYVPMPERRLQDYPILVRTMGNAQQMLHEVAPAMFSVDSNLVITATTLEQLLRDTELFLASSLAAGFASVIGILGLTLALMGIYSTVRFLVVIRTREMGIRLALGAKKSHVVGLMLRQSLRPVVAGLMVGVCLAVAGSYFLRGILYGVGTVDGISLVGVSIAFTAVALLSAYFPSRRVTSVNPVVALRCE